jgi:protein-disulfide isomerase
MRLTALLLIVALLSSLAWSVSTRSGQPVAESISPAAPASQIFADFTAERAMGDAKAPVTMVEYFSLTCPHCAKFKQTTFEQLKKDYIDTGKMRYVARDFPFEKAGLYAAMLARCAPKDRYFPLVDLLFKGQQSWGLAPDPAAAMTPLGKFAGMSDDDIKACFTNQGFQDFVIGEHKEGMETWKINSTPTFIFNDGAEQFSGDQPYDKFKSTIDGLLAKK